MPGVQFGGKALGENGGGAGLLGGDGDVEEEVADEGVDKSSQAYAELGNVESSSEMNNGWASSRMQQRIRTEVMVGEHSGRSSDGKNKEKRSGQQ